MKKKRVKREKMEKKAVEKRGQGRLSFPAKPPPPPQPAGRGGKPPSSGHRSPARAAWSS
jgi:hypothetical protein